MKDGFTDVMAEVQNDYIKLGIQLLQDDNGNTVEGIERKKRGDPGDITVEILRQWLQGKGRKPITWQTLVECLEDTNLHVAANHIKFALKNSADNLAFFTRQQAPFSKCSFPDFLISQISLSILIAMVVVSQSVHKS